MAERDYLIAKALRLPKLRKPKVKDARFDDPSNPFYDAVHKPLTFKQGKARQTPFGREYDANAAGARGNLWDRRRGIYE